MDDHRADIAGLDADTAVSDPDIADFYPRHSRESGNPDACSQDRHPKSSTNSSQRIPSPFMGLQGEVNAKFNVAIVAPTLPIWTPTFPLSTPVIPAKAGIHTLAARTATRNQAQIAAIGSLLPLWEKARMRVRRAQARLCGRKSGTTA